MKIKMNNIPDSYWEYMEQNYDDRHGLTHNERSRNRSGKRRLVI